MRQSAYAGCLFSILMASFLLGSCAPSKPQGGNVILMVVDGCSTSVLSAARWYNTYTDSTFTGFNIDPYICGLMRTYSVNSPIPGSPGAMSAIMTGQVTRSSTLAVAPSLVDTPCTYTVDPSQWDYDYQSRPLMTLLEAAAHEQGKKVGMVVTVEYWHATPAACSSHALSRSDQTHVCRQIASQGIDVLFGGGTDYIDDDIAKALEDKGISLIRQDVSAFEDFSGDKVWSLFAPVGLNYEIDRKPSRQPSLAQMTSKALDVLSKGDKGFFLMVEGSKVDYAAHAKDPVGLLSDFKAFDDAVGVALDFAKKDGNTTVVVVADHGTSGMTIGNDCYYNYVETPLDEQFGNIPLAKASGERIADTLMRCAPSDVEAIFKDMAGIIISEADKKAILERKELKSEDYMKVAYDEGLQSMVGEILNQGTHIGFVSGNHTGEDVFMAVYSPDGVRPEGVVKAVELNRYLGERLGLKESLKDLTYKYFTAAEDFLEDVAVSQEDGLYVLDASFQGRRVHAVQDCSTIDFEGKKVDMGTPAVVINGKFFLNSQSLR